MQVTGDELPTIGQAPSPPPSITAPFLAESMTNFEITPTFRFFCGTAPFGSVVLRFGDKVVGNAAQTMALNVFAEELSFAVGLEPATPELLSRLESHFHLLLSQKLLSERHRGVCLLDVGECFDGYFVFVVRLESILKFIFHSYKDNQVFEVMVDRDVFRSELQKFKNWVKDVKNAQP